MGRPARRLLELDSPKYEALLAAVPTIGELFRTMHDYQRKATALGQQQVDGLTLRKMLKKQHKDVAERRLVLGQVRDLRMVSTSALTWREKKAATLAIRKTVTAGGAAAAAAVIESRAPF